MPDKKHLLVLTSSYPSNINDGRAAAGFFVKDFVKELSNENEVTVLTQHTGEGPDEIKETQYSVIRFPWLSKNRPLSTLCLPKDILPILSVMFSGITSSIKQIKEKKTDHIIAMWAIPCGIWALVINFFFNTPYTIWCLGSDIWNYQNSFLSRYILVHVLKNAHTVYADGFELCGTIKDLAKIDCTYLPSSRHLERPTKDHILKPDGVRHYLFVGRYHPNKGPDILINAINLLSEESRKKIHLHMFGGGDLINELKQLIKTFHLEDTITLGDFIGESELTGVLHATDAIVIPSRKDSIPLMLSAALKVNKTIIATDVGDTGFLLKKYLAGRVTPAESAKSFALAIEQDLLSPNEFIKGQSDLLNFLDLSNSAKRITEKMT